MEEEEEAKYHPLTRFALMALARKNPRTDTVNLPKVPQTFVTVRVHTVHIQGLLDCNNLPFTCIWDVLPSCLDSR